MDIRTHLSDYEKSMMTEYIKSYAFNSDWSTKRMASIDQILQIWSDNKGDLFNLFGGNLIISKQVKVKKPNEFLNEELNRMWGNMAFGQKVRELLESSPTDNDIVWKTESMAENGTTFTPILAMWELTKDHYLADNTYFNTTFKVQFGNDKELKVEHGCKTVRILNKIVKMYAEVTGIDLTPEFEEYRLEHSRILNTSMLEGTLCLSIHPMDFMTMSDNDEGWSSCMSWRNQGCYRQGTVEMMNSNNVIIAYLTHRDWRPIGDDDFIWNSKSWRSLFVVDHNLIASVKGYPYTNDDLNCLVIDWLRELKGGVWSAPEHYYEAYREQDNHGYVEIRTENSEHTVHFYSAVMYNDFGLASSARISFAEDAPMHEEICYSGATMCVSCGRALEDIDSGWLLCDNCAPTFYCNGCREYHYADEMSPHDSLCLNCYRELSTVDEFTGELFLNDNKWKNRIWLVPNEVVDILSTATSPIWVDTLKKYDAKFITTDISTILYTTKMHEWFKTTPMITDLNRNEGYGWMRPSRPRYFVTEDMLTTKGKELYKTVAHPYPMD